MTSDTDARHRLNAALDDVEEALTQNVERSLEIQRRVAWFRDEMERNASVLDLVAAESVPRAVEMLTANAAVLETAGAGFRIRLAHALRAEGLTIDAIAGLFGVTRQRISALLRQAANG